MSEYVQTPDKLKVITNGVENVLVVDATDAALRLCLSHLQLRLLLEGKITEYQGWTLVDYSYLTLEVHMAA